MKNLFLLLLIFLSVNVLPQSKNDSLLVLLESLKDTARIKVLSELCWDNRYTNPPEALKFGLEALSLLKKSERYSEEAEINNYLGVIHRNVGDHATALEFFFNAHNIAREQHLDPQLAYSYNNIGDIYNREGNYQMALENELKSLDIFETLGDSLGISYSCHQISLTYAKLSEYSEALKYDVRAMNIRELHENQAGVAYSLISIGQNFLKMGLHSESLENLLQSREIFMQLNDTFGLSTSLYSISIYYKTLGSPEDAIKYLNESLHLSQNIDAPMLVRNAAQLLSELYAEQEKFKEAYQMHILYKDTYDSLYHEENLVKITQLVMQHGYDQKELLQVAEIARQKQFRNYLIFSFGLVVILVIVIFNRYYIKRKANIDLQLKNNEIESQKNKLENLFISLRIKNEELSQQNEEISSQKDHLESLNQELEKQKFELNRTLKELTQAETQLVQSEKMASLGQLTAGVAHELNNPINFVSSGINPLQRNIEDLLSLLEKYDSIIKKRNLTEGFSEVDEMKENLDFASLVKETQSLLKGINEGASRSQQIVKDLRTFSRMDENDFKGVDIHDGLDSTLMLLRNKMEESITVHKEYGKIPHIECLPGKLNQVFMNILTNSILAIEGKGDIYIETSKFEDRAKISIRDTGCGMSPDVKQHIFEPFFTTRTVGTGTGLGLSISYSIIEEHHGTIEVHSEQGEGTEFVITLPISRKD